MLVFQDFVPLVESTFQVIDPTSGSVYTMLTLAKVEEQGRPHPGREVPFSMFFDGPSDYALDQGTYLLRHETLGEHAIFVVPVADQGGIRTYQSIFN